MPIAKADRIIVDRKFVAETVEDIFLKYRADIIADLRESLIKHDRDQPGDLLQSIDGEVTIGSNKISFELKMNDYWKFVNEGVDGTAVKHNSQFKYKKNGKRIPLDAMKKFIAARGISPAMSISAHKRNTKIIATGKLNKKAQKTLKKITKENALESLAWAIGVNLKKRGLKPTHFFTQVINKELKERLTADLSKALLRDIEIDFTT